MYSKKEFSNSNDKNSMPTVLSRQTLLALACSTIVLSACGSRGADDSASAYQGQPADTVTTQTLQRNAASATSESMGTALNSVVQAFNNSAALGQVFTIPGSGISASPTEDGVFSDPSEDGPLLNAAFEQRMRAETGGTFNASLGLSGQAVTTRSGNTITIDPDESAICSEQVDSSEQAMCEQLLVDLTVKIDADSDKSGTINYLFREQSVALVGYSPISASYELKLAGLQSLLVRANELDSTNTTLPDSMSGAIRFEVRVLNTTAGAEAGTMSFSIPEALSVVDSADGTNINIAPSTLMQLTANAGTGDVGMEVNVGAMSVAMRNDELAGNPLAKIVLNGITARANISRNGNVLSVSNVGLGNGPLIMSVDSLEAIRASLSTFGFEVNQESNTLRLDGDLDFAMSLRNVLGTLDSTESHDSAFDYSVSAPNASVFSELVTGVMRLDQGGPLVVGYDINDGNSSATGSVNVGLGQCFGEGYTSDSPIDVVGCN